MTGQAVAPDSTLLLEVDGLRVNLAKRGRQRRIVTDAAFRVAPGEAVAIVGESGSGKSVTARAVMGLLADGLHAEGAIHYRGSDLSRMKRSQRAAMCGRDMTMILQDPFTMLNPTRRCGEQVSWTGVRDPDGRQAVQARAARPPGPGADDSRRSASPTRRSPSATPFELSGGMRQRVALAAALAQDPQLLIADEPSTALDVTTQAEILRLIESLQESRGMGLILITHDLRVAFSVCDRVYVFYAGRVIEASEVRELLEAPLHPYTVGLLLAEPPVDRRVHQLRAVAGSVPQPDQVLGHCASPSAAAGLRRGAARSVRRSSTQAVATWWRAAVSRTSGPSCTRSLTPPWRPRPSRRWTRRRCWRPPPASPRPFRGGRSGREERSRSRGWTLRSMPARAWASW